MPSPLETTLVKLSALKANIDASLAGDISNSGWGLDRTLGYLSRLAQHVEELRKQAPDLFGNLPRRQWTASIATQKDALRQAERDMREIFVMATNAKLWEPVNTGTIQSPPPVIPKRSWLLEHLWQVLVTLLVAYIVFRLGWNR